MAKGKATNPKARTKAVPKKTPKPPAPKKRVTRTRVRGLVESEEQMMNHP